MYCFHNYAFILYRDGKYKLIQGSPGLFNDWAPVPNIDENDTNEQPDFSGPQQFPPYQLFDLDGKVFVCCFFPHACISET